jgi:hypothetical protein
VAWALAIDCACRLQCTTERKQPTSGSGGIGARRRLGNWIDLMFDVQHRCVVREACRQQAWPKAADLLGSGLYPLHRQFLGFVVRVLI